MKKIYEFRFVLYGCMLGVIFHWLLETVVVLTFTQLLLLLLIIIIGIALIILVFRIDSKYIKKNRPKK